MQPGINPFRLQNSVGAKSTTAPTDLSRAVPRVSGVRGQSGEERAKVLSAMSQDPAIMAARVHYLKTLGKQIYNELNDGKEIDSSRLAWLQRKLNQQDI